MRLSVSGNRLVCDAPKGVLDDRIRQQIAHHKAELLEILRATESLATVPDPLEQLQGRNGTLNGELVVERFNTTATPLDTDRTITRLFLEKVAANPSAPAVLWGGEPPLDYRRFAARAGAVACRLIAAGVRPGQTVAVCARRSPDLLAAIHGILMAGAAYAPLGVDDPGTRLAGMLEDLGGPLVLATADCRAKLEGGGARVLDLEHAGEAEPLDLGSPKDLAYVLFTSGSTGRPKGVAIEQHSVLNRVLWMQSAFPIGPGDVVLQKTPVTFDVSVWELFWWSWTGAAVALPPPGAERDPQALVDQIERDGVTVLHFVPSMLAAFLTWLEDSRCDTARLRRLRYVFASGEALDSALVERFDRLLYRPFGTQLHNLYGPTEATVDVTWHPCSPWNGDAVVPIGRPIANTTIYVLDDGGRPTPVGAPGEIHIGGCQVARGYVNRPELTAEKFIADPFRPGGRLYRTGDLGRWRRDGTVEYLGRIDQQVKVRGQRIEPGEIEHALEAHPSVERAVVSAVTVHGLTELHAYILPRGEVTSAALRFHLRDRVTEAMVPARFFRLDALPLSSHGKLDRKALTGVPLDPGESAPATSLPSEIERRIVHLWQTLLHQQDIGIHDNFFDLGGHSLLLVQLQSRLRRDLGVDLSIKDLFQNPTVAGMAAHIAAITGSRHPPHEGPALERIPRDGEIPLSFAQTRLWFLEQLAPGSAAYVIPMAARLRGTVDVDLLQRSLSEIVRRHEVLRTVFPAAHGSPKAVILPAEPIQVTVSDLTGLPEAQRESKAREIVTSSAGHAAFDLTHGPLLRTQLLKLAEDDSVLLLTVHHAVFDGWSVNVFWQELSGLYSAFREGTPSPLAELPVQYADYAAWQRRCLQGPQGRSHLAFWKKRLEGCVSSLELPADRPRSDSPLRRSAKRTMVTSPALCKSLHAMSQREGVSLFVLLLAAFQALLHRLSGQDDILVGTPIAGRNRTEFEEMIGFFINTVVVRTRLSPTDSFRDLLAQVHTYMVDAYEHQEMPFEELVAALDVQRDLSRTPLFQVLFNHLNFPMAPARIPGLEIETFGDTEMESKFDLTLYTLEQNGALHLVLLYDADLFSQSRMGIFLHQYANLLELVSGDPSRPAESYSLVAGPGNLPDPALPLAVRWFGSVHSRFVEQAVRAPNRVALVEQGSQWKYQQLERVSAGLAEWLRRHKVGGGDIVAIYGSRSASFVAALLGVLRAGAAFCILDPAYPAGRLTRCLQAARPRAWLQMETASDLPDDLRDTVGEMAGNRRLTIPAKVDAIARLNLPAGSPASSNVDPDSPAYVTFTSGTTGSPKCILGTHRPLSHFIDWHVREFDLKPGDQFSMLSGLAHDPLLRDIFTPLWMGATLHIPSPADILQPGSLSDWMKQGKITVAHLTPAMASLLCQQPEGEISECLLPALRYAFFGGDALSQRDVARVAGLAPEAACVNFYGTTETPQAVAYRRIDSKEYLRREATSRPIPIGGPIEDTQLIVLNRGGILAGPGELGEIHVRSPYLSSGYINDDALTRERFVTNPHTSRISDRMYRTGDLGRYRPDGFVDFAGRADGQIKIRGFRIETGEIEAALADHPGVQECAVVAREVRSGGKQLIACFVPRNTHSPAPDELRPHLRKHLPEHMIPAGFVMLDAMPLTPNGKVDRRALALRQGEAEPAAEYTPPRNRVEQAMTGIWAEVLEVPRVGVLDNFFELGGHSLSATLLITRMRSTFGIDMPLRSLFLEPTIAGLARLIRFDVATQSYRYIDETPQWTCLVPAQPQGTRPPLFFVAGYESPDDTLLVLSRFIPHLGLDQPVFGFRPRWVDGVRDTYSSVAEMAREFIAELRTVQPIGPYFLGGHCLGGVAAFEMAQQLVREGEEVRLLALLDAERPTTLRSILANARLFWSRGRHVVSVITGIIGGKGRSRTATIKTLLEHKLNAPRTQGTQRATATRRYHMKTRHRRLMYGYEAETYPGRITLLVNEAEYGLCNHMGWKGIPQAGLKIYKLPGDHDSILPRYGKEFASALRESIDSALPQPGRQAKSTSAGTS